MPGVHQQTAVRPEAWPWHAAEPVRPGDSARQDCREARTRSRGAPASDRRTTKYADRELSPRRHHRPRRMHPARHTRGGVEREVPQAARGPRRRPRVLVVFVRRRPAIYWNDMPHSGVQLKLDRSGGVTAFCGATEIGQGSDDVLVACVAEILGIDPIDIRAVTGDTDLTPV